MSAPTGPGPRSDGVKKTLLIEEVKKYPLLYSTSHPQYRDLAARDRAWDRVATALQSPREACKHEWKILRDSLRQALRNKRQSRRGEHSTWYFEPHMSFLLPHITYRERQSSRPLQGPDDDAESKATLLLDIQQEEVEETPVEGDRPGEGTTAGADELFYAGVCASARRLSPALQRTLRKKVLLALLEAEEEHDSQR